MNGPVPRLAAEAIFLFAVATTLGGAFLAALSPRIIRSVCGLAISCIGLAGLYYFLHSPFLALMEILIYVGAVCVTIVFAVMLAEPEEPKPERARGNAMIWGGLSVLVCVAIFWGVYHLGLQQDWTVQGGRANDGSIKVIGASLLTTYSLAFELISLALLVAILGALAIAGTGEGKIMNASPLYERADIFLFASALLLVVGIFGLIRRRTLIGMLISGELIFSAASLNLMTFNHFKAPDPAAGQIFVLFIMGLAAAEVAIALSIIIAVYRNYRSVKTRELSELNG